MHKIASLAELDAGTSSALNYRCIQGSMQGEMGLRGVSYADASRFSLV